VDGLGVHCPPDAVLNRITAELKDADKLRVGALFRLFERFLCALFQFFRGRLGDGLCN
jgi:hypothetical protein